MQTIIEQLCQSNFAMIEQFLESKLYQQLKLTAYEKFCQEEYRPAKIGSNHQNHLNQAIRGDQILWLEKESNNKAINSFLQGMQEIITLINQQLFLGLNEFESHFAIYPPGAFYKKHVDQFNNTQDRRVSCVYYLNDDWLPDDGGELILYTPDDKILSSVLPQGNQLLCFMSHLPHEVKITQRHRYSIAGWMKVRGNNACML